MRNPFKMLLAAAALVTSLAGVAGTETATDANDVILAGHDAVAYFTENKPVLGSEKYTAEYDGAVYRFASAPEPRPVSKQSGKVRTGLRRLLRAGHFLRQEV